MSSDESSGLISKIAFQEQNSDSFQIDDLLGDDQFLSKNPEIKKLLLQIKDELHITHIPWKLLHTQQDQNQNSNLKLLEQQQQMLILKKSELLDSIKKLSHQKRRLASQIQIKNKISKQKKQSQDSAIKDFESLEMFKFQTKQQNTLNQKLRQFYTNQIKQNRVRNQNISVIQHLLQSQMRQQQKRKKTLNEKNRQLIKKDQKSKKELQSFEIVLTIEQEIQQKLAYLRSLQEENQKLKNHKPI